MLANAYQALQLELEKFLPAQRIISDPLRTLAYGTDASFYRLIPKLVVDVVDEDEAQQVIQLCAQHNTPLTFRAAGTSLSGQAVSDSVLLRLGLEGWNQYWINEDASEIRLQPGIIGAQANRYLAPFGKKIGPDPASINAAKIGGIAANNASGMCCGTAQNSYQTLRAMRLILADGTVLDTADAASRTAFNTRHGELLQQLSQLAAETKANTTLAERIRHKFKIKNTTGYSLNALIDFDDPFEILQHLMIGSEGTLGFIAEISYQTVEEHAHKASSMVYFPDIRHACEAVAVLKSQPVAAVELIDRAGLRSVAGKPGMPDFLDSLPPEAAALLIETRAAEAALLHEQAEQIVAAINTIKTLRPVEFTDKIEHYSQYWAMRKGLFPAVGAVRKTGTTVIIEDVAYPVPVLADATLDLQALFRQHGYHEAIIFGHALEGNLHFVFTQDFSQPEEVERYRRFMDDVCTMTVDRYDGSLKAEHSTGRNMAPFVEMEWGQDAFALMQRIKALFDPNGILNPGVILNDDAQCHLKNLKALPPADPLVDKCIECGFCEPVCPSREVTLTPRQRIVGLRELSRRAAAGESAEQLSTLFQYQAVATCAADSLCSLSCPVGIDTGKMMKTLRARQAGKTAHKIGNWAAGHYGGLTTATRWGLGAVDLAHRTVGRKALTALSNGAGKVSGGRLPSWHSYLPTQAKRIKTARNNSPINSANNSTERPKVVYFPSCASQAMGPARGDPEQRGLIEVTTAVLQKAGFDVIYPAHGTGLCCGQPFDSKGLTAPAEAKRAELEAALLKASQQGQYPIVFDTSPCAFRTRNGTSLQVYDIAEFIHDVLLERLEITPVPETVALHPTCSTIKMGLTEKLKAIAERCAATVVMPEDINCCGWAGDKGFTHPELNAAALRPLKNALPDECQSGYSTSRTCEIGLSLHSGRYYHSILYLLDRCSAAKFA